MASVRHDGEVILDLRLGADLHVETQVCLPPRFVRSVAQIADVGKNRPDVAIELYRVRRRRLRERGHRARQQGDEDREDASGGREFQVHRLERPIYPKRRLRENEKR
jgi:hypothetical protein